MIEYKYIKVKGHEQKKFTENGHTMFETDVLQRLKRLAYLEAQLKEANENKQPTKATLCQDITDWASVKSELPPNETGCYLVSRGSAIGIELWKAGKDKGYWYNYIGITHWMALPKLPCR